MSEPHRGLSGSENTALSRVLWPGVAAVLTAWVVAFPLTNTDIWWHLASGRSILDHGLLDADPFSISARNVPWTNIHWLFQVVAYPVWVVGGALGLVLAKMATAAAGAALLITATPPRARPTAVAILIAALFAVRHLLLARPIVVTLLLLAAMFLVLERYRERGDWRWLLALPALQIVWVNVQGLHTLGPILIGCYLAGALLHRVIDHQWSMSWRPLAITLAACALASLLNPYGIDAALLPWKLFARIDPGAANIFALNVSEFAPPWLVERASPGATLHLSLFLLAFALVFLLDRWHVLWPHVVVAAATAGLALMAQRNILLLYWLGAPILAVAIARRVSIRPRWSAAVTLALAVAVIATREGNLSEPAPFRVPEGAARRLDGAGGGNLFCSVRYGGYLALRLQPRWSPYIDGRLILRTRQQFADYLAVLDDPPRFDALQDKYGFAAAVLPTALPDRYLGLVTYLLRHPDWHLSYTDGTEVLLLHDDTDGPTLHLDNLTDLLDVRTTLEQTYPGGPARTQALIHLARLVLEVGRPQSARDLLAGLSTEQARYLIARSYFLEGDLDLAALEAERLLAEHDDDLSTLILLAAIAFEQHNPKRALETLRRALELNPYDARALELLRRAEETK